MAVVDLLQGAVDYTRTATWLHRAVFVEVAIIVIALVATSMGTTYGGITENPGAVLLTGGILGVFALVWGILLVVGIVVVAGLRLRMYFDESPEW